MKTNWTEENQLSAHYFATYLRWGEVVVFLNSFANTYVKSIAYGDMYIFVLGHIILRAKGQVIQS